jgi:CBS domain-containing protein
VVVEAASRENAPLLAGMFTERDVLRRVVAEARCPEKTTVADVMTREVIFCAPDTPLEEVARLMKEFRVRHLPVIGADGTLRGLVSIGDVNAYHVRDQQATIYTLEEFIYGRV